MLVYLAARFRIDLASAMMLVGRASQGQTQLLTRYGIVIDQTLSDQDKFNELLKIGAESFHLAEEQARTAEGTFQQFHNAMSDIAEVIGGPLLEELKKLSSFVTQNKLEITDYINRLIEGYKIFKKVEELKYKPWKLPGALQDELSGKTDLLLEGPRVGREPGPGYVPSLEEQMGLEVIRKEAPFMAELQELVKQKKAIETISPKYNSLLQREIELTGRIGEAHWHAAKMIEFESELRKAGVKDVKFFTMAVDAFAKKLKELEHAQRLARIANDIGDAFAGAFEDAIFEAKKLRDVFNALIRDIAKSVFRNLITQPMGLAISSWMGGGLGLTTMQHGGIVTSPTPALIGEAGPEAVIPLGGKNPLGLPPITFNYTGMPLEQEGEPIFDGERWIIELEAKLADRAGRGAGPLAAMLNG